METISGQQPENFTGAVHAFKGTAAGKHEATSDKKKLTVKFGWFPDHCDACAGKLEHADLIGKVKGTIFSVRGYICPHCGHKVGKLHHKHFRDSCVRFNWTSIVSPMPGRSMGETGRA